MINFTINTQGTDIVELFGLTHERAAELNEQVKPLLRRIADGNGETTATLVAEFAKVAQIDNELLYMMFNAGAKHEEAKVMIDPCAAIFGI